MTKLLSSNKIKIIACICMLLDHIALYVLSENNDLYYIFRSIGRLAFPIFAFCIAEGCYYTRDKKKYTLTLLLFAVITQIIIMAFKGWNVGLNILFSFTIASFVCYEAETLKKGIFLTKQKGTIILSIILLCMYISLCYFISLYVPFDYGFWGMMLPVIISIGYFKYLSSNSKLNIINSKWFKICLLEIGLIFILLLEEVNFKLQAWSLITPLILFTYNEKRGSKGYKWAFYVFYPFHLTVIFLVGFFFSDDKITIEETLAKEFEKEIVCYEEKIDYFF